MLDTDRISAASDLLYDCWVKRRVLDALPVELRPATRAEGYAIQACLVKRTTQPLFGWKIAATSVAGQRHIGVDGPIAGRILAENVRGEDEAISLDGNRMRVAEVEFAFRFGADVLPRKAAYTVEDVLASVASLHPAIEVPDSRYENFATVGAAQLIADDACAHLFVLGEATKEDWRQVDLATMAVSGEVAGQPKVHGSGANVLGDPRVALTWIVNELSALEIPLRAGEIVTTGTCVIPMAVHPGDRVSADFGPFGTVHARFA